MKIFLKTITFLSLIYFIYSNQISNERNLEMSCSPLNNCFNCSACGEIMVYSCPCKWSSSTCILDYSQEMDFYDFTETYENCVDSQSKSIQNTYCGQIEEDIENNKLSLSLPKVDGYYGQLNLFCTYVYKSHLKSDAIFKINIERNDNNYPDYDKIQLQITIVYKNDDIDFTKKIDTSIYNTNVEDVKEIIFKVECRTMYSKSPFSVNITYTKGSSNIGLIIAIIVIILICIAFSIIVYYFSRKISENARIRHQQILEAHIQRQNMINNNIINEENNNKRIIEYMLKEPNMLGKKICQKEHEKYGTNCTICLEELKIGVSEVSLTPCQHVFHYECLSNWLKKKDCTYKCPVCNFNLLNTNIPEEQLIIKGAEVITIRRNSQINNNTAREVSNGENNNLRIISPNLNINNNNQINNQDD